MSQLNAVLTNGVFYYQAAEELCPDQQLGKLCWPRKAIAKEVIDQFRAQWDRLNLPGSHFIMREASEREHLIKCPTYRARAHL